MASFADDLDLNPKFVFCSPAVPAVPLAEHVDRAIIALDRRAPLAGDCSLETLRPFEPGGTVRVEIWVDDLDDFTCTYGFLCSSDDGRIPYARGQRTVVSVDPATRTPQKWSSSFRLSHTSLRKDLPGYA